MSGKARIVALGPHDGTVLPDPAGGHVTFKARTRETGGAMTVFESEVAIGEGPPEHVHADGDEAIYVLDGELRFRLGSHVHPLAAGSFVFIPRGTPHCFQNVGAGPARLLVIFTPCGMERHFEQDASAVRTSTAAG